MGIRLLCPLTPLFLECYLQYLLVHAVLKKINSLPYILTKESATITFNRKGFIYTLCCQLLSTQVIDPSQWQAATQQLKEREGKGEQRPCRTVVLIQCIREKKEGVPSYLTTFFLPTLSSPLVYTHTYTVTFYGVPIHTILSHLEKGREVFFLVLLFTKNKN